MNKTNKDHIHNCSIVGAFMAINPIEDSLILFFSPPGCKKNVHISLCAHDLIGFDKSKLFEFTMGDAESIFGAESPLKIKIKEIIHANPSCHLFVLSSCTPEIIGEDLKGIINEGFQDRVTVLNNAGFKGDLWEGYSDALVVLAENIPVSNCSKKDEKNINIIGYFFDRNEYDNISNIRILEEIMNFLGFEVNNVMIASGRMSELDRIPNSQINVVFDFGKLAAEVLSKKFNQKNINVDLPIGLDFTCSFIYSFFH